MSAAVETRDARPTVTFVPRGLLCWEQVARGVFFVMQHVLAWPVYLPRSVELQAAVSRPFRPTVASRRWAAPAPSRGTEAAGAL